MTIDDEAQAPKGKPRLGFDAGLLVFPAEGSTEETGRGEPVPADEGPTLTQVAVYRSGCSRNDHDPSLPGFLSWGGWWGPEHFADSGPAEDQALADSADHFDRTGHTEAEVGFRIAEFWVFPVKTPPEFEGPPGVR